MLKTFVQFLEDLAEYAILSGVARAASRPVFPDLAETPAVKELHVRLAQLGTNALPSPQHFQAGQRDRSDEPDLFGKRLALAAEPANDQPASEQPPTKRGPGRPRKEGQQS